jgi:predicted enzyme related to lactoylglutathione lyase
MTSGVNTIVFPVKQVDSAKAIFTSLLGGPPQYDSPYYVGWNVAGQDIGLDPNGFAQGLTGPVAYWTVDDIRASVDGLLAAGAETVRPVTDVGGGKLIAVVKDADGNLIGVTQNP